ncbi:MAG TPA: anti-sigma factor [Amaricoccus sp.]|nr:anti-sigma factor [Amaricoccus sp.]
MSRAPITEHDLHAYVDGALDLERRALVDRYLAEHPLDTARVAAWERQNATLSALYGHIGEEPVPPRLDVHRLASALLTPRRRRPWRGMAIAATLCLAIGLAGGWIGRGYRVAADAGQAALVDEAVAAHGLFSREVLHPVEVRADQHDHLAAWLSKRLDRTLVLPDLRPLGFELVGGRLLPAQGRPAAQLMYEDAAGQRVTFLIVAASDGQETALQYGEEGGVRSLTWTEEAIRCVLVGDLSRDRLRDLATLAYQQLG